MSKLESLTQRILEDAQSKAESMLAEADRRSKGLLNAKVKDAHDRKDKILEKAVSESAMTKDRVVSSAELKVRDEKLTAKQEIMDNVFSMAKERLEKIDDAQFSKFMGKALMDISSDGKGTIIVPASKKTIAEGFAKDYEVIVDEKMDLGFMLKDGDVFYNYTFGSLVDELRDKIEGEIAVELFKELE